MKEKTTKIVLFILLAEKIVQHLYTAAIFLANGSKLGTIDINPYMGMGNGALAICNIILALLLIFAFYSILQNRRIYLPIIISVAVFDILAEFIFHGFFFITVSVITATLLLIFINRYQKLRKSA